MYTQASSIDHRAMAKKSKTINHSWGMCRYVSALYIRVFKLLAKAVSAMFSSLSSSMCVHFVGRFVTLTLSLRFAMFDIVPIYDYGADYYSRMNVYC